MSKPAETASTNAPTKEETQPTLGVLEEDDEFEEFAVQGMDAYA
jgi:26 proteasome complex subunit DSS1